MPVVIDHIGRVDASLGLEQPGFRALLALMDDKNVWVKVSGCDRITRAGPPYADAVPFARKLVAEFGDRCVWGTDWPHPNHTPPVPDDGHAGRYPGRDRAGAGCRRRCWSTIRSGFTNSRRRASSRSKS